MSELMVCDSIDCVHCIFDIFFQLQDKATLLTAERKKRGKTVPEGLANSDDIRSYRQLASHVVYTCLI